MQGNPFPLGRPAGPEELVDREDFIAETVQRLSDGHSVVLAGPRRTGKSSVAAEMLRRLHSTGSYTAAVDLFYVGSVEEFAEKLLQSLLENRTGPQRRMAQVAGGLREILSRAQLRAKIHDLELGFLLEARRPEPERLLEAALATAEHLAERDGRRMVVLVDEFQEAECLGGKLLLERLRANLQPQRRTAWLFLGSRPTLLRSLFADRGQAFYRFAVLEDLPPVPRNAWRSYIAGRLAVEGIAVTQQALELLLERTGGHPYCTMAVAYNAYLQARMHSNATVDADTVLFSVDRALEQLDSAYEAMWQEMRRAAHADRVLAVLATGGRPYAAGLPGSQVSKALARLHEASILVRGKARGEHHLVEPLFGEWLRRKLT